MKDILPKITTQFESLKPSFTKIDRMEELIARINADFDVIEKQLEDAENTIVEGTLKNVLKMPLNLFNKQLSVTEVKVSKVLTFLYKFLNYLGTITDFGGECKQTIIFSTFHI